MSIAEAAAEAGAIELEASQEDVRREKLKQAGAAYFEKVLAQTNRGKGTTGAKEGLKQALPETFDDTFETVGAVVEGSKLYVLGTVYVASLSSGMVFTKSSLDAMDTPGIFAFLHFLPVLCALWLLAAQGSVHLRPFNQAALSGSTPTAVTTGLQVLFLFCSLRHCSVPSVLCWVTIIPQLLHMMLDFRLNKSQPRPSKLAVLLCGLGAVAASLAFEQESPGAAGFFSLLLWAAAEGVSHLWTFCTLRPHLLVQLLGERRGEALQGVVEQEQALDPATLVFLRHALPLLPLLVLGLAMGEGSEMLDHDLSVPSVTMILLSIAAYSLSAVPLLLIQDGLLPQAKVALAAAAPLGTVVVEAAVHGVAAPLGFTAAVVAVVAGLVLRMSSA